MTFARAARPILACGALLFAAALHAQETPPQRTAFDAIAHVAVHFPRTGTRDGAAPGPKDWVRVERPSSGVVIDSRGFVLTPAHLVAEMLDASRAQRDRYRLEVELSSGEKRAARIAAHDARLDLVLLALELVEGEKLACAELCNEAPLPGVACRALGLPESGKRHCFAGALGLPSAPAMLRGQRLEVEDYVLSSGALLDTVDGGALVDGQGRMLGVVNTSHVLAPIGDPKPEDLRKPDYALAISAAAIRKCFADELAPAAAKTKLFEAELGVRAVRAAAPAIVSIWSGDETKLPSAPAEDDPWSRRRPAGLCTGVSIDERGLIATSARSIPARAEKVLVRFASGKRYTAEVLSVRGARTHGIALLRLELADGARVPCAALVRSTEAHAGEWISVLANPHAQQPLVSSGILSAAPRDLRLQVAARVHEGFDGGALIDARGRVLGIASVDPVVPTGDPQFVRESGMAFAIALEALVSELAGEVEWPTFAHDADAEREALRTPASYVVEETLGSLLNVYVKTAAEKPSGFDPFGGGEQEFHTHGLGSGVVIDAGGLAITNWHVVDSATQRGGEQREDAALEVSLPDGRSFGARVLSTSRDDDLALLQLELPAGTVLKPVELGDSDALAVGDAVIAIGNPFGRANTVSGGVVATLQRDANIKGRVRKMRGLIQTDAAINPGNSGGALLDAQGRLIGINSAGNGWTTGEGFAIPVARVKEVFRDKLLSVEGLRSVYLGITPREDGSKLVIERVDGESPASRAGLAKDDVLLSIGETRLERAGDYARALLRAVAGSELAVAYERAGQRAEAKLLPLSHLAYAFARQTGLELAEVDYRTAHELLRDASLALHRAYTGDASGEPQELMQTVLRVERIDPSAARGGLDLRPGDLLLGVATRIEEGEVQRTELLRFEKLAVARACFAEAKRNEVRELSCWVFREGKAFEVRIKT